MDLFFGLSRRFWVAYHAQIPESVSEAGMLHARILRAIAVSDGPAALLASDALIDFLETFTRRTVSLQSAQRTSSES